MHVDARDLPNNSVIQGDVCIIGAGAAGISIALEWITTPYKVILLEGGGFEYDDKVQELYNGKTTGQKYYPLKSARLHYFGGTTGHWVGMCSPFNEIDFKKRDWVPNSGWPIGRNDLDPFYARAHKTLKLGPFNYDLEFWRKEVPNLIPYPLDKNIIWNKIWQFSQARFGNLYRENIVNAKNVHLYTYANAVEINATDNVSEVNEVVVKNYAGKTHTVKAKHFILACGAIQNARMLLASNSQEKAGLGNNNDIVGRYFMEHLELHGAELWMIKPFPTDLYSWSYGKTRAYAELAIKEEVQAREKITNGTVSFSRLSAGKYAKSKMETWQEPDPRKSSEKLYKNYGEAAELAKNEKGNIERAFLLQIRIEQAPNPNSRVTIDTERDELGVPRAHLNWELTALDKKSVRRIFYILGRQMAIAGLGRMKLKDYLRDEKDDAFPDSTSGGWHHMGTTRMSDNPKNGVVDSNCQVHGINNLYVAGSGCYVTSAAPNPTLTLVALSIRLSDFVKSKMS